jgi:lipopolysaccharide export system permease protein
MHRELARGDYTVRQADYDIAVIEREHRGGNGKPPTPPKQGAGFGVSKLYCGLMSLVPARSAHAQAPVPGRPPVSAADSIRKRRQSDLAYQARLQEAQFRRAEAVRERNRYDVEIQKKFSLAASCMIFVLVGAPIALRFPRGGVGLVIGVSFAIFGLYYVGLIGGESLADKAYLPPWVAMWAANIILLVIGLILASQMGREASTARGGDFAELLATARSRVFGWLRMVGIPVERRRA